MQMKPYGVDVAVLVMFFCRPQQLEQVFEQVRLARPSRLYLHQDGPRSGRPSDLDGISRCREIVSSIDWECEVHTLYRDVNLGCGPAQYMAEKWMFETEEMGIVLEDDVVPAQAFFTFCKELLEKYRYDRRIDRICGMNNTGVSDHIDSSYLFAGKGSIWGWASWKRVLDGWDPEYAWLDDESIVGQLQSAFDDSASYRAFLAVSRRHRSTGLPFHESAGGFACLANSRLFVVPKFNLVSCVGASEGASHCAAEMKLLPRRTRKLFMMKRYEIHFPLAHPEHVIRDRAFEKKMTRTRLQEYQDKLESAFLLVRYGDFLRITRKLERLRSERK